MEDKKDLEIVSGDGSNLNISPVYEHLHISKPKSVKKPTHIVVPKESSKDSTNVEDKKEEEKK